MSSATTKRCYHWRKWTNVIVYLFVMFVGVLGASLRFNGTTIGNMAQSYSPYFFLQTYSFVIYGVLIYIALLAYIIYQLFPETLMDKEVRKVDVPFWVWAGAFVIWNFGFYYDVVWLAFVAQIAALGAVISLYLNLGVGVNRVGKKTYWLVFFPFCLLTAFSFFYMLSTFSVFCIRYNWMWWGMSHMEWTVVMMLVLSFVGACFLNRRPDMVFGVTFVWGFVGVAFYASGLNDQISMAAKMMALFFAIITYATCFHCPRLEKSSKR
jgi:hypothetical protein